MIVTSSLFAVGLPQHSSLQHFTLRIVSGSSVKLSVAVASGVSYGGDNNSSQSKGCALSVVVLIEFPSTSFFS